MLVHPQFDPVAIHLGPLAVRWYGLMYLVGFVLFVVFGKIRARQNLLTGWHPRDVDDMLFYGVFGVILGGRLGYILFYKPMYYLAHPMETLAIWQGGMSFHGGFLGVLIALFVYARVRHKRWLDVTDFVAPLIPLGLAFGRLGNFINGELWGRVTDPGARWAVLFPQAADEDKAWMAAHAQQALARALSDVYERTGMLPRHPSQLYEAGLEGVLLFTILWLIGRRNNPPGTIFWSFLTGYGLCRIVVELFREPDAHIGFIFGSLSMGQMLSLPMIVIGVSMLSLGYQRRALAQRTNNPAFKPQ